MDEIEQRRECKAEFLSSCCCGGCATTLNQNTQKFVLLFLNPDSYRQILAFLRVIKTKQITAVALNKVPISHTIEDYGNVSDQFVLCHVFVNLIFS